MATTVMGAASAAAGITIPFLGYMALTKTIFFLIGPVGWAIIGTTALHKITKPNYAQMAAIVAWAFLVRNRVSPEAELLGYSASEAARKIAKFSPCLLLILLVISPKAFQECPPALHG